MSYLLLGASRGLGLQFQKILQQKQISSKSYSRTLNAVDFTKASMWDELLLQFQKDQPEVLIYFAGGGPYGAFQKKDFKDHQWAFRLNFEFPAFLLHSLLKQPQDFSNVRQVCFVGSSIAESQPDANAASYAAAKHALKGLVTTVQRESPRFDLRLFSPGYMDTSLLPADAWPRQKDGLVASAEAVAADLWAWLQEPQFANGQRVL